MKKLLGIAVLLLAAICYNTMPKDIALRQTEFLSNNCPAPTLEVAFDILFHNDRPAGQMDTSTIVPLIRIVKA